MAVSQMGQFMVDKEARAELEKLEQLKRIGHAFIRVVYTGRNQMPRMHGFETIGIVTEYDETEGKEVPRATVDQRQSDLVEFRRGPDGRMVADVWDTAHNRHVISRHLDMDMEVEDPTLAKAIGGLTKKPYTVEPDARTRLLRERERIEQELAALSGTGVKGRRPRVKREADSDLADEPPVNEEAASG